MGGPTKVTRKSFLKAMRQTTGERSAIAKVLKVYPSAITNFLNKEDNKDLVEELETHSESFMQSIENNIKLASLEDPKLAVVYMKSKGYWQNDINLNVNHNIPVNVHVGEFIEHKENDDSDD